MCMRACVCERVERFVCACACARASAYVSKFMPEYHHYRPAKFLNSLYSLHLSDKSILSTWNRTCTVHLCRLTPLSLYLWQPAIVTFQCTHAQVANSAHDVISCITDQNDLHTCTPCGGCVSKYVNWCQKHLYSVHTCTCTGAQDTCLVNATLAAKNGITPTDSLTLIAFWASAAMSAHFSPAKCAVRCRLNAFDLRGMASAQRLKHSTETQSTTANYVRWAVNTPPQPSMPCAERHCLSFASSADAGARRQGCDRTLRLRARLHTMHVHTMRELDTHPFKHASRRRDLQQGPGEASASFGKNSCELNCSPKNELFARKSN